MMTHLPKISILMPSYNQGRYLDAAIRSVLNQDYPNKELILIDGGSTDSSLEIIRRYQADLAYAVSEKDRGQTHALNKAMLHASGEIIGWLNSDDLYLQGAFSAMIQAFQSHPQVNLVHGNRILIDREGHLCGWSALEPFDPARTGYTICSETVFWRRSACSDQPFNEELQFAMDLDFFCRLYGPERFLKLNRYIGAFRCHEASKSSLIPEVGRKEAKKRWGEIFPESPDGWSILPKPRRLALFGEMLKHPGLIAFPYLRHRFLRAFGPKTK